MEREDILRAIRRTAEENRGVPPGARSFEVETGIKPSQWRGKYWAAWGAALADAGFAPNQPIPAYDESYLVQRLISVIRRVGHFPTWAERSMERGIDPTAPSQSAYRKRFRSSARLADAVVDYCEQRDGYADVLAVMKSVARVSANPPDAAGADALREGSVYLYKMGRHYKIGLTYAMGRRAREFALQLPEKAIAVHVIQTDDPEGIERYWHRRFESKRKNGEWFELSEQDVRAFKRRRLFM